MAHAPDAARPRTSASRSPSPWQPPLLRLTPGIRLRLYRYLGLASWDGSPSRFDLRGGRADYRPYAYGPPDPIYFHGLLLSCRTIYAEAAALLYSANCFVVYYSPTESPGLQPLRALTTLSLRSLSNLKIVVNEAACHKVTAGDSANTCCLQGREEHPGSGLFWCRKKHRGAHQAPLLRPASAGSDGVGEGGDALAAAHDAIREWHVVAAHLFSSIIPGRFALSLVCDIDPQHPLALNLASSVVASFHRLSPTQSHLKDCRIRLAKTPDRQFYRLARDAALHACGLPTSAQSLKPPPSAAATTLASLPRELRVRILEHTDLVTPRRQVTWSRQDRAYVVRRFQRNKDSDLTPDELHSQQFFDCWLRTSDGCFCGRRHAAFSLACQCWAPPGPTLFLVCRTLSAEAQYVFFSRNRFIIHDYKAHPAWAVPSSPGQQPLPVSGEQRFAVSEFLREVVPASALAHIRFLELVFPPYLPQTWPGIEAVRDWWAVVERLQDKVNLSGLTLRIIVMNTSNGAPPAPWITTAEGGALMAAYMNLLQPLQWLAELGLAEFYAHFPYPWETALGSRAREAYNPRWVWGEKKALKDRLERYVMGDRYGSLYADGKAEPVPSDWDPVYFTGFLW